MKRSEPLGFLLYTAGDFVAMQSAILEHAEDDELGGASLDAGGNHKVLPYV